MVKKDDSVEQFRQAGAFFWAILGGAALAFIVLFLIYSVRAILPPFIYAFILVYLLRPVVNFFVQRKLPRLAAVGLTYLLVILVLTIIGIYFFPLLAKQVGALIHNFPRYLESVIAFVTESLERFSRISLPKGSRGILNEISIRARSWGLAVATRLPEATVNIFGGLFNLILAPIIAFYILKDLPAIKDTLVNLFPQRYRDEALVVIGKIDYVLGGFLRGQALVALVVGITISIYLLILRVNFAIILGMLTGILNIIPYFGPIAGGIIAASVALFQSPIKALAVVVGMLIVQQLDGILISPIIMRHTVNVHPAGIIFALLVGGTLFGFMGLLLAIPVAAVVKALLLHYVYEGAGRVVAEGATAQGERVSQEG